MAAPPEAMTLAELLAGREPGRLCDWHPHAFLLVLDSAEIDVGGVLRQLQPGDRVFSVKTQDAQSHQHAVRVGRGASCDVRLRHRSVSSLHAILERHPRDGSYVVQDRGSHNGTIVDAIPLRAHEVHALASRTVVWFGGVALLFLEARDLLDALRACGLVSDGGARPVTRSPATVTTVIDDPAAGRARRP